MGTVHLDKCTKLNIENSEVLFFLKKPIEMKQRDITGSLGSKK